MFLNFFNNMHAPSLIQILYHVANALTLFSFLLRDQLRLRSLLCFSFALQGVYYAITPLGPIYDALFWKIVTVIANLSMILLLFRGNLDYGISADLRQLYNRIKVLAPGQFKRLAARSERIVGSGQIILKEGERPEKLFYLLKGQVTVLKAGKSVQLNDHIFLGEIAFLSEGMATATVILNEGSECVVWDSKTLQLLMKSEATIDIALRGLFNHDLAAKVANIMPIGQLLKQA